MKISPEKLKEVESWLSAHERSEILPLYSSVDIRNGGYKTAVVDTNLFPAGFNNLCSLALNESSGFIRQTILDRVPSCQQIVLVIEEHTRNKFYLENVYVIQNMLLNSGFKVDVASLCETEVFDSPRKDLETSSGKHIQVSCFNYLSKEIAEGRYQTDLIILNNDLTRGIPKVLEDTQIPIYPSLKAGWHSRLKSHHFKEANVLLTEFAQLIDQDPWRYLCLFDSVEDIDINNEVDRNRLAGVVENLLSKIQEKYNEYGISDKPFVFLKSDTGTYGMGVVPVESVDDVLNLNRKLRNKLSTGKSSMKIARFIIQEGVPTISNVDNQVSEACIYQIANRFVGGFYRVNTKKSDRDNLNSPGMTFIKMCEHSDRCQLNTDLTDEHCGVAPDEDVDLYRILARIAGVAAHREIVALEKQ